MAQHKKILCLDFDGVLHSYTSGWKGARNIPDPPVPGAIPFLLDAMEHFEVCILSSRSHQWGGRRAMKRWLVIRIANHFWETSDHNQDLMADLPWTGLDVWDYLLDRARKVVRQIGFPRNKPPAHVTIDDRALTFKGTWPEPQSLLLFQPWNKRTI